VLMERRWDDELTGTARNVAASEARRLKVVAGPGTGKTFALTRRVARRLQGGVPPKRILAITFTRIAANDLKKELDALAIDGCDQVDAVTLHSLCFRMLSRATVLESTGRTPRPLLAFEERFMIEDLSGDGFGGIDPRRGRLEAFKAAWARLQTEQPGWPQDPIDSAFQNALVSWLRLHRAMLVGELVPVALSYLRNNPHSPFLAAYDHVFTDEYQDLNKAEQVLVDLLAAGGTHTVVGDEDQSIYSFKHAHPEGIREFECDDQISLDQCRRCPVQVIDLANSLIANNPDRTVRQLLPAPQQPAGEVQIVQWPSLKDEADGLAQLVKARIDKGQVEAGKVLVLCPVGLIGYKIRDSLNKTGVKAHSFFAEEALEGNAEKPDECQAQQAYTLLNLLVDRFDRVALRCWCGFGTATRRAGPWSKLRAHCEATGEEPWNALERLDQGDLVVSGTKNLLPAFRQAREGVQRLHDARGTELVDAVFPEDEAWSTALRDLIASFNRDWTGAAQLRDQLRSVITQPELPTDVEYVRVMSLHKSKGLTADLVVVADCIQGVIPRVNVKVSQADQDRLLFEQRRLFYVALTRAKNVLILSSVSKMSKEIARKVGAQAAATWEYTITTLASQFLDELGPSAPKSKKGKDLLQEQARASS
jgi:ATP-dependent DNA helicase UvrD/PcrA